MIDKKKIKETADKYAQNECGYSYDVNKSIAFEDGVNWFKENLWHEANEEPKYGLILVEFNGDMEPLYALHQYKEYTKLIYVSRWLYVEDLMKGGE